ncbi:hypothetical protein [Nocardia sp. NPDC127526]|uniref:hypothetical protein n=1 Tax=Nocardia sp. NPDC127526 TaxID=3345393 RepID=UPI00362FFB72
MPNLITLGMQTAYHDTVLMRGEKVTEHFAIAPALTDIQHTPVGLAGGMRLVHLPTGLVMTSGDFPVEKLRELAAALEDLPLRWDVLGLYSIEQARLFWTTYARVLGESFGHMVFSPLNHGGEQR